MLQAYLLQFSVIQCVWCFWKLTWAVHFSYLRKMVCDPWENGDNDELANCRGYLLHCYGIIFANCKFIAFSVSPRITNHFPELMKMNSPFRLYWYVHGNTPFVSPCICLMTDSTYEMNFVSKLQWWFESTKNPYLLYLPIPSWFDFNLGKAVTFYIIFIVLHVVVLTLI